MKTAAAVLAALIAFTLGLISCTPPANSAESTPGLTYSAHVQKVGWQAEVEDGATAGTPGRGLRVEALRLAPSGGATLSWRGHVQKVGWQGWRDTPAMIGTTGKGLRLEAFQITVKDKGQLYGDVSVEYRAYVQGIGWQPWVSDGEVAGTMGKALRIEAVQIRLVQTPLPEPTPTATVAPPATTAPVVTPTPAPTVGTAPPAGSAVKLAFTADTGVASTGKAVLAKIGTTSPDVMNILGDLAYQPSSEQAFCDQVKSRIATPVVLLAGNHEEKGSTDGYIDTFTKCLPDPLGVAGTYAKDFYYDRPNVRVVMISPDIVFNEGTRTYKTGTPEREWLKATVREAKAAGKWTILGMHHPCFSIGMHGCADTTAAVSDLAIGLGVDVVFTAHDHNYMRTHQIRGTKAAPVLIDKDNAYKQQSETTKGTVFVTVGNGGHNPRTVGTKTSIWAVANGTNSPGGFAYGFGEVTIAKDSLSYRHVSAGGASLADQFVMTR